MKKFCAKKQLLVTGLALLHGSGIEWSTDETALREKKAKLSSQREGGFFIQSFIRIPRLKEAGYRAKKQCHNNKRHTKAPPKVGCTTKH
ncbi:hypothetical protein COU16_01745 [Candidatus Kaiserbacteria bacterium CG10_big_fil_rev_8_21_14_0_10_47_16]|uniref:Uncharacterized protein n=1 Tax=Candidatus Kaiserbacteria bacterium CG10_big_fil_rev_8_21_14_0_10_47_16 TaxID=1974608 RepID=A0A2H0UD15_9BACT|nr:MAG: hypothetical protein COU16_01745 [Candidatus Kaiserbacteria bacterium CG10_big_fil_rev_8_21_14_0_10_47_16]